MTSGTGTPGYIGADPRLHGFAPGAGVLPASQPPSQLRLSPTATLPSRRRPQRPAACHRDGWHPKEGLHCSLHLPCAPTPCPHQAPPGSPRQQPHLLLPATLHPGSVIQHGGSRRGGVGCGPSRPPPNPRAPRRGAWPGEQAPFPVPAVVWPALGCSVPRSAGGCSTFAALSHRRRAAAASSPAPAEDGS